ncbi:MAG: WavE lipopolysaccharide synthesis family protein [Opitutales bacterium]
MNLERNIPDKIFSDVTIVVQGPISKLTEKSLLSVRKYLPKSHIILSTWKGSDCSGLDYDELVLSDDPQVNTSYPTNLNRMIVSAFAGLKEVKTKYVLRMRTDFILTGINFINLFFLKQPEAKEYKFFEKRVVSYVWKSKKGRLFQCGDFFFFGLTKDVIKLFDIPLCKKEEFFWLNNNKANNPSLKKGNPNRYHAEQYLWLNMMKSAGFDVELQDYIHYSKELKELSERVFVNNLIFTSFLDFSIFTGKSNLLKFNYPIQTRRYSFFDWNDLCKKYFNFNSEYKPKNPNAILRFLFKSTVLFSGFISIFMPNQKLRRKVRFLGNYIALKVFLTK